MYVVLGKSFQRKKWRPRLIKIRTGERSNLQTRINIQREATDESNIQCYTTIFLFPTGLYKTVCLQMEILKKIVDPTCIVLFFFYNSNQYIYIND